MANSAATITYDEGHSKHSDSRWVRKIIIDWTSDDGDGTVTATTDKIVGTLLKVVTNPGSPAPSANYDIAITESDHGLDVLSGLGGTNGTSPTLANRHTTTTEVVHLIAEDSSMSTVPIADSRPYVCDTLAVAVTNAGNSKQGQIIIYYR